MAKKTDATLLPAALPGTPSLFPAAPTAPVPPWDPLAKDYRGLQNQLFDLQRKALGLDEASLQRQAAFIAKLINFRQRARKVEKKQFKLGRRETRFEAQRARRDLRSDTTAAGAGTAEGTRQGFRDIHKTKRMSLRDINLRQRASGIAYRQDISDLFNRIVALNEEAGRLPYEAREIDIRQAMSNLEGSGYGGGWGGGYSSGRGYYSPSDYAYAMGTFEDRIYDTNLPPPGLPTPPIYRPKNNSGNSWYNPKPW